MARVKKGTPRCEAVIWGDWTGSQCSNAGRHEVPVREKEILTGKMGPDETVNLCGVHQRVLETGRRVSITRHTTTYGGRIATRFVIKKSTADAIEESRHESH